MTYNEYIDNIKSYKEDSYTTYYQLVLSITNAEVSYLIGHVTETSNQLAKAFKPFVRFGQKGLMALGGYKRDEFEPLFTEFEHFPTSSVAQDDLLLRFFNFHSERLIGINLN